MAESPQITAQNRVERFYSGGKLLDTWQGISPAKDCRESEEFLVSTIEYKGTGFPLEKGVSRVSSGGGAWVNLHTLITGDPKAFLGPGYAAPCQGHAGVQARAGDTTTRLIIQCHPDDEKARSLFHAPFGKTEAWYIQDTRTIEGLSAHVYCGFKKGITRQHWERLFADQDVPGMLACLHCFDVQKGDCVLVKAGVPHAIGSGCLFVELHQPCDFTLRMERTFNGVSLTEDQMHYGAGFQAMFDCYDYTGYERHEVRSLFFKTPHPEMREAGGTLYSLIGYEDTPCFAMKKLEVQGEFTMPTGDGHYVLVTLEGGVELHWGAEKLFVPQGRGIFVPAACRCLRVQGTGVLLVGYPFQY